MERDNRIQFGKEQPPRRHLINLLYDSQVDFNCFGKDPAGTYMLATIPRSGSTYCAIKLWQTGLLGAPMEYLNFRIMGDLFRRLKYTIDDAGYIPSTRLRDYWRDVQRLRTSPNGVFGYKMFPSNYSEIATQAPEFLAEVTPNYVIYLTRNDIISQAISYSRAQRSRIWFSGIKTDTVVDYDFDHIRLCARSIENQKSTWEKIFALTGVTPLRIFYEDLMKRESHIIDEVINFMGIRPDPSAAINVPVITRQADTISQEWHERYLEDLERTIAST